jgi:prevent-host-death family protein
MFGQCGRSREEPRRRIFYEDGQCPRLAKKVKECVDMSQQDKVVITRHGKPAAVLVGVEGKDWGDVALQTSSSFWKLIEGRRKESTLSMK